MKKKLVLGLFFGGRSVEHEVSVITALQAHENLDKEKYEAMPVYISKNGEFYTNSKFLSLKNYKDISSLKLSSAKVTLGIKDGKGGLFTQGFFNKFIPLDVAFPLLHGSFGEDGCIQGLFETFQLPYVGFNVLGSAIGMDKAVAKVIFQSLGLPVGKYKVICRTDWQKDPQACLRDIKNSLSWPVFVKPATVGSSIGVNQAKNMDQLIFNIEVAAIYSEKILIEEAFKNTVEINCSALGYKDPQASVCEQPMTGGALLSFEDKYLKGRNKSGQKGMASSNRIIPAPIDPKITELIQKATVKIFKALDGCGVARVDYFFNPKSGNFWVNEINTLPGSLSFYLWKPKGVRYPQLLDLLVQSALERAKDQSQTQYTFESGLLSQMAATNTGQAGRFLKG